MASNIRDYKNLAIQGQDIETVTKAGATVASAFLAYNRSGAFPAADGGYAAGVCTKSTGAQDRAMPIAQSGYAIVQVKPGSIVALDGAVAVATTGQAIPAAGANFVLGYALDSSDGSGTALKPHYIVVKLAN